MKLDLFKCVDILMVAFVAFAWSTVSLAQAPVPAANFATAVSTAQTNLALINDLYFQLQLAQKQLATVQGSFGAMQKDLTAAQVKAATCK